MNGTIELKTARLLLRKHLPTDAPLLYEKLGCDPAMSRYSGWNPYASPEMAEDMVSRFIANYRKADFYGWAIESEGELIGTVGAYDYDPEGKTIELGISIQRSSWGQGYATEALAAVLDYLTKHEEIQTVTAWCASDNHGSRKAMEKIGMQLASTEADALEIEGKQYDKLNFEYHGLAPEAHPLPDGQDAREEADGPQGESPKAIIAAILANVGIGIVKFIAAAISGSSAMISEGIHSIVDSGNGLLILLGMKKAKRKADLAHPFGYSQELYFWTLVVAIMIFALGGGFSIYEGIHRIMEIGPDTTLGNPTMTYIVLAASAVLEGSSLFVAIREFNKARGDIPPLQFIKEAKDPSLFTVVLEDSAAETGLLIAFLGTLLGHLTGNAYFDGIASVLIGILLALVAIVLLRETKGLLIGEGLKAEELEEVKTIIEEDKATVTCGRILTLYLGPHDLLLNVDVTFRESCSRDDIDKSIDRMERKIVRRFPQTTRIFVEPENLHATETSAKRMSKFINKKEKNNDSK